MGKADVVTLLVQAGADLNLQDNGGWTPIYVASRLGEADVVTLLMQAGALP